MKNGGLVLWSATAICDVSKTSWQMGKLRMKDDVEKHSKGPVILFGVMVENHPIYAKDKSMLHQFGKKGCARNILRRCINRRGNSERSYSGHRH